MLGRIVCITVPVSTKQPCAVRTGWLISLVIAVYAALPGHPVVGLFNSDQLLGKSLLEIGRVIKVRLNKLVKIV